MIATVRRTAMKRTRRAILQVLAGMAASNLGADAQARDAGFLPPRTPDDLATLFDDRQAAALIGQTYLAQAGFPRPNLERLQSELMAALQWNNTGPGGDRRAVMQARLRDRISQDFTDCRVVMVDGWMLSQAELQVCAIAYLSPV